METQKLTTAERYDARHQRNLRRARHMCLFGAICMAVGLGLYFIPVSQAAISDGEIMEIDSSELVTETMTPLVPEYEYAYFSGDPMATGVLGDPSYTTIEPAFFGTASEPTIDERVEKALGTPLDGIDYEPGQLLVSMRQGTTDADIEALVERTGFYVIDQVDIDEEFSGPILTLSVGDVSDIREAQADVLRDPKVSECMPNVVLHRNSDGIYVATTPADDAQGTVGDADGDVSDGEAVDPEVVESTYDGDGSSVPFGESVASEPETGEGVMGVIHPSDVHASFEGMTAIEASLGWSSQDEQSADDDPNIFQEDLPDDSTLTTASDDNDSEPKGDPNDDRRWDFETLRMAEAWKYSQVNGALTVAVLDDGFDLNHKDLNGRFVAPYYVEGKTSNIPSPANGHGTHVAGIIGATAGNRYGISGISHNAFIMPIDLSSKDRKRAAEGKMSTETVCAGLKYVADHVNDKKNAPVRVVNMSVGVQFDTKNASEKATAERFLKICDPIIDSLAKKQVLVVCSAGNEGQNSQQIVTFPVSLSQTHSNVIGVINLKNENGTIKRHETSNYNPKGIPERNFYAQIGAPGTDILSCWPLTETGEITHEGYARTSGTSMAAPQVAGLAALMFAANPKLTPVQVRNTMCLTATDVGEKGTDVETGYGMINPVNALKNVTGKSYDKEMSDADKALAEKISVSIDNSKVKSFKPTVKNFTMKIDTKKEVTSAKEPTFTWTYDKKNLTMSSKKGKNTATNANSPRDLGDGRKVIDYKQTWTFTFKKKDGSVLNTYGFTYLTHVLTDKGDNGGKEVTDAPKSETPDPAKKKVSAPGEDGQAKQPDQSQGTDKPGDGQDGQNGQDGQKEQDGVENPQDSQQGDGQDTGDSQPKEPSNRFETDLPHARVTSQWVDAKGEMQRRYTISFPYIDEMEGATASLRVNKALGKTAPTQNAVTEFLNSFVPVAAKGQPSDDGKAKTTADEKKDGKEGTGADEKVPEQTPGAQDPAGNVGATPGTAGGNASVPSEIIDEETNESLTLTLESSEMGTGMSIEGVSLPEDVTGPVQYRICRFSVASKDLKDKASFSLVFWIAQSDIANSAELTVGSTGVADLVESLAWANHPVTLMTADEGQQIVPDVIYGKENLLVTDDHAVAEGGITGVGKPFSMADDGCVVKEKSLNKIINVEGSSSTKQIDEYVYQVSVSYPDIVVTNLPKDGIAPSGEGTPISKTVDVTIQTTSAKDKPEGMGDNPTIPTPDVPSDPFADLKGVECWIAGQFYTEFSYDKTDYAISFKQGDPFPNPPDMKNVPEDKGWKVDSIISGTVLDQDAQRHKVTIANTQTHVAREYTFVYEHEGTPDQNPVTRFFGGDGSNASSEGDSSPSKQIASTGGRLVQTGDAILIVGGALITVSSGAWLLVYGRKKSNEA